MSDSCSKVLKGIREIRHPEGHGIDCTVDEEKGVVEIVHGKCKTILKIKPGPVAVKYTRSKA